MNKTFGCLLLGATVALSACGGSSGTTSKASPANTTASTAAKSATAQGGGSSDLCSVFSAGEATAVLGVAATKDPNATEAHARTCVYDGPAGVGDGAVELHVIDGDQTKEDQVAGVAPGTAPSTHAFLNPQPASGLGPHAFTNKVAVVASVDASHFLTVSVQKPQGAGVDVDKSLAVAHIVYPRLIGS